MTRWIGLALALAGCGYQLAHAPNDPLGPFVVVAGRVYVPDAPAIASAEEGARAELARAGALAPGDAGARLEIEVLRVDETGEGIALEPGKAGLPLARGVRVTVVGRARLRRAGSDVVERDTGDVRASEVAARADGPGAGSLVRDELGRAAARRLGEALVRRLLGVAEPGEP
jgi:hypothetical protein